MAIPAVVSRLLAILHDLPAQHARAQEYEAIHV